MVQHSSTGLRGRAIRVGLDIGGTKTDAVAVAPDGDIIARVRRPTGWGDEAVIASILDSVAALSRDGGFATSELGSVGVGIPGLVEPGTGRVLHAVNLGVESLDISARAGGVLKVPIAVENDVKAAALGAAALRGDGASMAYLNLGTGVAAGIVADGRIWRGMHGTAGEVGHLSVDPAGRLCGCGQRGCVDTVGGARGMERLHQHLGHGTANSYDIIEKWQSGDANASRTIDCYMEIVAPPLALVVNVVGANIVPVGGGLGRSVALIERLDREVRDRILRKTDRPLVVPARSDIDSGLIGAAILGGLR